MVRKQTVRKLAFAISLPTALIASGILFVVGCSEAKKPVDEVKKPVDWDKEFTQKIPGRWVIDVNAKPGDFLGDDKYRDISIVSFRPDGTFTMYSENNSKGVLGTWGNIAGSLVGCRFDGKCWVHDEILHMEVTGSPNPLLDSLGNGKELRIGGRVISIDKTMKVGSWTYFPYPVQ